MSDRTRAVDAYRLRRSKRMKNKLNMDGVSDVDLYRYRRYQRLTKRARMDAEDPAGWITVNGNHIPVNEAGEAIGGQPKALGGGGGSGKGGSSSGGAKPKKDKRIMEVKGSKTRHVSAAEASSSKKVGSYERKNSFKNGYRSTSVDPRDRDSASGVTMKENTNEAGEWTEAREALHSEIIDNVFDGVKPAEGKPVTTFMGGGPSSGKTYVVEKEADNLNLPKDDERVLVDPDGCKHYLPEYDPNNPGPVHEESSSLAKRITKVAQENGYNVLVDGTGDGSADKMRKKIEQAKAAGHEVNGVYVFKPVEDAIVGNFARERTVNTEMLVDTHKAISNILPEIAKDFDNVKLYANMKKGEPPVLIAEGGGGKDLQIINQDLYNKFLDNANYQYDQKRVDYLASLPEAQKKH